MTRCVVTGGSGFLGRHIIDALFAQTEKENEIVVFDIRPYVHHDPDPDRADSIKSFSGNISQLQDVTIAFQGADVVFHCATANPLDNQNKALMKLVNVDGTRNVVEACKRCCVPKLVYVSTASVAYDGTPMRDVDETHPLPSNYTDFYSMTKAEAEKIVLDASGNSLRTCSLRPSSIFGERDASYVPSLIANAKKGSSKYVIGDGNTKWEFTYVGNIAKACLQAADRLEEDSPVPGNAYFITNDERFRFWEHVGIVLQGLGYPAPSIHLPKYLCFVLATILELLLLVISPLYKPKSPPVFTRQKVRMLTTDRTISCAKAKRDFGYYPSVSMTEGTRRTIEYFKKHSA